MEKSLEVMFAPDSFLMETNLVIRVLQKCIPRKLPVEKLLYSKKAAPLDSNDGKERPATDGGDFPTSL